MLLCVQFCPYYDLLCILFPYLHMHCISFGISVNMFNLSPGCSSAFNRLRVT